MYSTRTRRTTPPRIYRPGLIPLESRQLLSGDVLTFHNDNFRTGANVEETSLTPANVNSADFGKIGVFATDGKVDAQPLYVSGVQIPGQGTHDVLYVATENDSLYAFDAQSGAVLWHDGPSGTPTSLLGPNETAVELNKYFPGFGVSQNGILATPVIDPMTNTIYLVASSVDESGAEPIFYHRVHAIDIRTGEEKVSSRSVDSSIKYPGTGPGSDGMFESFNPKLSRERVGLTLSNGVLYTGWTSNSGVKPYEGWLIAFNANDLNVVAFKSMNANEQHVGNDPQVSSGGSIWMSGGGLAVDEHGFIYAVTGNGPFDPGIGNFGDSVVKFANAYAGLEAADFFSPYNQADLAYRDWDLGSSGIVLIPDQTDAAGNTLHLAVNSAKDGNVYVTNRDALGRFNLDGNYIHQEIVGGLTGLSLSSPIYFNGSVYLNAIGYPVRAFSFLKGQLGPTPTSETSTVFSYPGTTPSISANGTADAILWTIEMGKTGVLHAYDAYNLSHELYNSNQAAGGRDQFGPDSKFVTPTIAHGKVYVATPTGVAVFGSLQATRIAAPVPTPPPGVLVPAFPSPSFVVGGQDLLGVVGSDASSGESSLTYTWSVVSAPRGAPTPVLGINGTNQSKLIQVGIGAPGDYGFRVTITRPDGQVATSDVAVHAALPAPALVVPAFPTPTFVVGGRDLLGGVGAQGFVDESALTYTWSVVSQPAGAPTPSFGRNGTNDAKLTPVGIAAPGDYGFRLSVTGPDGQVATSDVAVKATIPRVSVAVPIVSPAKARVGKPIQLRADAVDEAFSESALTYSWRSVSRPARVPAPKITPNGKNSSKVVSVSLPKAGVYTFRVDVHNPASQVASSVVKVIVGPRGGTTVKPIAPRKPSTKV